MFNSLGISRGYDSGTLSSLFIAGKYPQDIVALLKTLRLEFNPTMGQKACLSELALSNFSEYSEA